MHSSTERTHNMLINNKDVIEKVDKVNHTYEGNAIYYMCDITDDTMNVGSEIVSYEGVRNLLLEADKIEQTNNGIYCSYMVFVKETQYIVMFPNLLQDVA